MEDKPTIKWKNLMIQMHYQKKWIFAIVLYKLQYLCIKKMVPELNAQAP